MRLLLLAMILIVMPLSALAESPSVSDVVAPRSPDVGVADVIMVQAARYKVRPELRALVQPSMRMAAYGMDLYQSVRRDAETSYSVRVRAGIARDVRDKTAGIHVNVRW